MARRIYPPHRLLERVDQHGQVVTLQDNFRCEAWVADDWRLVDATHVLSHPGNWVLRCVGCHGPVHPESGSDSGNMLDRFEHDKGAHRGCPLFHRRVGPPSRSPSPIRPPTSLVGPVARDYVDEETAALIVGDVGPTEKARLISARVGQGAYRAALISLWGTCSVTGAGPQTILVASHIVPWCKCVTNQERIDPYNGLLLTPNLDKLFDRGLISFAADGKIRISQSLSKDYAHALGVHGNLQLRTVPEQTKTYLFRHVSEGHFCP